MVKLTRPYRPSGLPPEEIYKRPPVNANRTVERVWEVMHLGLEINRGGRRVRRERCGEPVSLNPAEFAMFVKLAEAAGEPCSENELMLCWTVLNRDQPANISGQIARLRKSLEPLRILISNKRASGYILEEGLTSHE
jgi:DNA-binding response OmpR family regulator